MTIAISEPGKNYPALIVFDYLAVVMCVIAPQIRFESLFIPIILTVTREPLGGRPRFGYEQRQSMPPSSDTKTPFVSTILTVPTYLLPGTYL